MHKIFEVTTEFWHRGRLCAPGDKIEMTPGEAKYRGAEVKPVNATRAPTPRKKNVPVDQAPSTQHSEGDGT